MPRPSFADFVLAHATRRGGGSWLIGPLLLDAAGLQSPPFRPPKHWFKWVEKYRTPIIQGRRITIARWERLAEVLPGHADPVLLSRPASTNLLLDWIQSAATAVRRRLPLRPLPAPVDLEFGDDPLPAAFVRDSV